MTTLNTIIEEEKNEARRQVADTGTVDVDALLTTAMQRAYEAGVEDVTRMVSEYIENEWKNQPATECAGFTEYCCPKGTLKSIKYGIKAHLDQLKKEITSDKK